MKRIALTLVETMIVMVIIAILISISTAGWAVITRGFREHAILDSAVQGIIYVMSDARGKSVESKIPQWVGIVNNNLFASGTSVSATDTSWRIPQEVEVSFDTIIGFNDDDYFYVFGAWSGDNSTNYVLLNSATITVSMTTGSRERKIVIQNGLAREL